jgi:dTDP-glucose 4,6-dehydratase
MQNILIAGGAGFIGANFVHHLISTYPTYNAIVFDKLTYAGNPNNLNPVRDNPRYHFVQGDICDAEAVRAAIREYDIDTIVNFAAETHVDRSILDPDAFVRTNVFGPYVLCEAVKDLKLERFHLVSTDEVYGPIPEGKFKEADRFKPTSPYAAAKAGGELLTLSYYMTYNLPITVTRGVNTYGPYQYPEKQIPLFVTNAIDDQPLPLYGDGRQVRDRLFAMDHARAIDVVLHKGQLGEAYNVSADMERTNIEVTELMLEILEKPRSLIQPILDRPAHDVRYALDSSKLKALGWRPEVDFDTGFAHTVRWYQENEDWWRPLKSGEYLEYYRRQYTDRAQTLKEEVGNA